MVVGALIPLITIGLAELGDKTQLSILLLAARTRKHLQLLLGVMLAFLVVDGLAVFVGSWITNVVPLSLLKALSGLVFIIFGILTLVSHRTEGKSEVPFKNPFLSGFALIFITEWGDKTQIAAGLLAIKYNPLVVLIGTMTALTLLSVAAVYLGKFIKAKIDRKVMAIGAGLIFILIGLSFFLS